MDRKNEINDKGYGLWKIYVYQNGDDKNFHPPAVEGNLILDNNKYSIEDAETGTTLLVVPAGNVAYAHNEKLESHSKKPKKNLIMTSAFGSES